MESDAGLTPYELRVKRNIEENQSVLRSLGLLNPSYERHERIKRTGRKSNVAVKSKRSFMPNDESPASPSLPARRTRRSSSILKSQGYDEFDDVPIAADEENTPPHKRKKIAPEPVFGPIEGVSVGDWWSTRIECSAAGVHRPTVAGIHGKLGEGCFSIALSGGYEDDIDYGEYFTYTGSGGRDLKGTKTNPKNLRTAPQTKDQVLEGPNAALALNVENRRAVRVIRGYKLPSPYAPEEGYRYDGLYSVERSWIATGVSGFKVYKFALKRLPDQDPPPWITNGSTIQAQNGHGESRDDGPLEEENDIEDTQDATSTNISTKVMKSSSKQSPNVMNNIENGEEVNETKNKGKRTSSELKLNSEETREKSKSSDPLNSSQQIREDAALKQIHVTPERNNILSNINISSEATIKVLESATDSRNSNENNSKTKYETEKQSQVTLKRKRTLNDAKLYTEGTLKVAKSSEDSLNPMQNVSEDKDENQLQNQITPKKRRFSRSSHLDQESTKETITETLNFMPSDADDNDVSKKNSGEALKRDRQSVNSNLELESNLSDSISPTEKITKSISDNETEDQTQTTPKRKLIPSSPKLDQVEIKHEPESPLESLSSMQNMSDDEDVTKSITQVTRKRSSRSSSSKPGIEGTVQESISPISSLNVVSYVSDKSPNDENREIFLTSRRMRTPTKPKPEGTKQIPESPPDSLISLQNDVETKDVSDKLIQKRPKRNRRSSDTSPDSVVGVRESNSSNYTIPLEINIKNEHSDINTSVDINRLNDLGKLDNSGVNGLKINEKSNDVENSEVYSCSNQLRETDHSGKVDNAKMSLISSCHVHLTPLSKQYSNFEPGILNSSQSRKTNQKSTGKSLNSTEKKVRFSPEVLCNYVEGKKSTVKNIPISSSDSENRNSARKLDYPTEKSIEIGYPQKRYETRLPGPNNSGGDSRKQTSILKYFEPKKKAAGKLVSSRSILLRSNRRSVVFNDLLPISESERLKNNKVPVTNSPLPQASKNKSARSKCLTKDLSAQGNCLSVSDNTGIDVKALEIDDNSVKNKKNVSPSLSRVKQCSVPLFRLGDTHKTRTVGYLVDDFLGWDWSIDEVEFLGFDYGEEDLFHGFPST